MTPRPRVLALSGWWMAPDALRPLLPAHWQTEYLDYLSLPSLQAVAAALQQHPPYDIMVGWSLGGQLAYHGLQHGWIEAKRLILIGTAYQFVANPEPSMPAMAPAAFARFRESLHTQPERTRLLFQKLLLQGDATGMVAQHIPWHAHASHPQIVYWFDKLQALCPLLPAEAPTAAASIPTLIMHGEGDAVVPVAQAKHWQHQQPLSRLAIMAEYGHIPPLHAPTPWQALLQSCD